MSFAEDARKAREMGLSYGQYIARYGKSPEQVRREAEARRDSDGERVIRRSYAHAVKEGHAQEQICWNCGGVIHRNRQQKFCCRACYTDYHRRKKENQLPEKEEKPRYVQVDRTRFLRLLGSQKLTQKRLGELSGCGTSTIGNMAAGRRVKLETLNKLAKVLGVPAQDLIEE